MVRESTWMNIPICLLIYVQMHEMGEDSFERTLSQGVRIITMLNHALWQKNDETR